MEILEADNEAEVNTVIRFPPDDEGITDEESGEEDEADVNHLSGRILHLEVELKFTSRCKADVEDVIYNNRFQFFGRYTDELICKTGDPNFTAVAWFELLFSKEVVSVIVEMSNLYALQRNHSLNLTEKEVKVCIAVLLTPNRIFDSTNSSHVLGNKEIKFINICIGVIQIYQKMISLVK